MFGIVTLGFFFIRMMPGGPADYLLQQIQANPTRYGLGRNPTLEEISKVLEQQLRMPPDAPLWKQYIEYLKGLAQGNFGKSLIVDPNTPALQIIMEAAPWTIFLSVTGLVYSLVMGILLGSLMAYFEGGKFDVGTTMFMILNRAVPYYVVAIILLYFLGYVYGVFPTGGRFDATVQKGFNVTFIVSIYQHAAMPILSILITGFGGNALSMRANSIRLLGSDYIRVAQLRGLSTYTISTRYIARNAILPMYTGIVIGLGGILGGQVILEEIFAYNGLGLVMFNATAQRDFPLLTASLIITTFLFVLGTLIADFTYAWIDPRAEQSSME
ncbi:MAG: ABC transporter permease [Halobacteriaceae archaeon]